MLTFKSKMCFNAFLHSVTQRFYSESLLCTCFSPQSQVCQKELIGNKKEQQINFNKC